MSTKIALFKEGALNQVATPLELYNNPIDLEAADFIGNPRINLLDGKAEMKNGQLVVKSDLGGHTFDAKDLTNEEFPKSGEFDCVLAIRPEQVIISREKVDGAIPSPFTPASPLVPRPSSLWWPARMSSCPRRSVRHTMSWTRRSGPSLTRIRSTSITRPRLA